MLCMYVCADPYPLYNYLVKELNKFNLLYVHFVEPRIGKAMNVIEVDESDKSLKPFKHACNATFLAAGGYASAAYNPCCNLYDA